MEKKVEVRWINCAKFVAILAVMTDHLNHVLYTSQDVAVASYFSVSLFIILAGMTAYMSDLRHKESYLQSIFRGCKNLVAAYLAATAIYQIYFLHHFDFALYVDNVIYFKASMHLYFVLLYVQLSLTNRFLFGYLQKCPYGVKGYFGEIAMFVAVAILAVGTTNYTNVLNVYGGGGRLGGGYIPDSLLFRNGH